MTSRTTQLSSFVLSLLFTASSIAVAAPPNVVFILADDLGYTDLACFGSKYYETPNLDGMAAQGIRFTSGYTCGPNCQPTRAALMSGQYGPRTGVYTVGGIDRFNWQSRPLRPVDNVQDLPLEKVTLAQAMKQAGYATAMFGKWHLGQQGPHHPGKRGFDEAIVSMGQHFDFNTSPKVDYPAGTYLADFLTDKAVNFIRRNKERPFFLYLPHFGVHSPHDAKPELIARFKDKPAAGGHRDPTYAAMIASVDESVGRVLATLDELKLSENTLVIFSSDNGGVGGYVREGLKRAGDVTDNAPLRSGKGSLYEGGIRVPYIFRWTGKIPPGTTCDTPICSVDLYPTLLAVAGAKPIAEHVLDGVSYLNLLTSGGKESLAREAIFWHFPGYLGGGQGGWRTTPVSVIRQGDWKLMEFLEDGRLELYNLREDLSEQTNLVKSSPDKARELHTSLTAWRKAIAAPMPAANAAPKVRATPVTLVSQAGRSPFQATNQDRIVPAESKLELLWNDGEFTEGPTLAGDGAILFSDIGARIMRFDPATGKTTVYRDPSGRANGLMFDQKRRLVACEGANSGGNRRISITELDGKVRTLADRFQGKRFNSPNDLAIDRIGRVYFTDPRYVGDDPRDLDFEGVFLVDTNGDVTVATRDLQKPNGILVAADNKTVFVADNNSSADGNHQLLAFSIAADGTLTDKKVLFDFGPNRRGIDGMTLDREGNIYATAGRGNEAGVYVFSSAGKPLALIATPGDPTNCVFGGAPGFKSLYITGAGPPPAAGAKQRYALYRIQLAIAGHHIYPK